MNITVEGKCYDHIDKRVQLTDDICNFYLERVESSGHPTYFATHKRPNGTYAIQIKQEEYERLLVLFETAHTELIKSRAGEVTGISSLEVE